MGLTRNRCAALPLRLSKFIATLLGMPQFGLCLWLCFGFWLFGGLTAQATQQEDPAVDTETEAAGSLAGDPLVRLLNEMDEAAKLDLFTFVAGNSYVTLQRAIAGAVLKVFNLDPGGDREKTIDTLAAVQMGHFSSPQLDVLIANGLIGRFALQDLADQQHGAADLPRYDPLNSRRLLCLVSGSNMETFADLALDLGFPKENLESCPEAYRQAFDQWHGLTFDRKPEEAQKHVSVTIEQDDPEGDPLSLFIRESGLLMTLSQQLDLYYAFPEGLTLATKHCGRAESFFDPSTRTVVLCTELAEAFAWGYVALFLQAPQPVEPGLAPLESPASQ